MMMMMSLMMMMVVVVVGCCYRNQGCFKVVREGAVQLFPYVCLFACFFARCFVRLLSSRSLLKITFT